VVGLGQALAAVGEGQRVLVDGDSGELHLDPAPDDIARYEAMTERRRAEAAEAVVAAAGSAETRDGDIIEVMANAASLADVRAALDAGADGIGLLRTELLFAGDTAPTEDEQYETLRAIALQLDGRPLTVRTFDAGADKPLPYLARPPEENPALGVRGLRLALAEEKVFVSQLRAVARLATDHPVRVMFPMLSTPAELGAALDLLGQSRSSPDRLEIGTMIEVPAAALLAERFATELDFFSIGTNDLAQYVMAADRTNRDVAGLADALHPAVLRTIMLVAEAAGSEKIRVAVCGELAGEVAAVPLLLGLGARELSAGPRSIPLVKAAVRAVRAADARALAREALSLDSADAVRSLLTGSQAPSSAGPLRDRRGTSR
jgi:phosphoenolpyruvate-protein kinase (PTS system EI component)